MDWYGSTYLKILGLIVYGAIVSIIQVMLIGLLVISLFRFSALSIYQMKAIQNTCLLDNQICILAAMIKKLSGNVTLLCGCWWSVN